MAPGTHLLTSWLIGAPFLKNKRERVLVTVAGISPDLDGIGLIIDKLNSTRGISSSYYEEYHHILCHNLLFTIAFMLFAYFIAKTQKIFTALLAFISVNIHIIADLLGSRGPDGHQWPIPYLYPFTDQFMLTFKYQWQLSAWPNTAITIALIVISFFIARKINHSPFEIISTRFDIAVFDLFKKYLGKNS